MSTQDTSPSSPPLRVWADVIRAIPLRPTSSQPLPPTSAHDAPPVLGGESGCDANELASQSTPIEMPPAPRNHNDLPHLTGFHATSQANDQAAGNLTLPAMLVLHPESGQAITIGPSDLGLDSPIRFRPGMVTMFPTIRINARENQLRGEQKYTTRLNHADDHIEVEFQLELDQLESFEVRVLTDEERSSVVQAHGLPADKCLAYISIVVKQKEQPVFMPRKSSSSHAFTPGSPSAALCACFPQHKHVDIYTYVPPIDDNLHHKWDAWRGIVLEARKLGVWVQGSDDWALSRSPMYEPARPHDFKKAIISRQPYMTPVHLRKAHGGHSLVYPSNNEVPRSHFSSITSMGRHYIPAFMYERDESKRQQDLIYNNKLDFPARFVEVRPRYYRIDVQIKNPQLPSHVSKVIPTAGTEVKIVIVGRNGFSRDEAFIGTATDAHDEEYHFSVLAGLPPAMRDAQPQQTIPTGATLQVFIFWSGIDATAMRRLQVFQAIVNRYESADDHTEQDSFNLDTIVSGNSGAQMSPVFVEEYRSAYDGEGYALDQEIALLEDIKQSVTDQQQRFFELALAGVLGQTLLLEGFPGSGKTSTLAKLVVIFMLLKQRVLVSSQPNRGVQALFDDVVNLIESDDRLQHLRSKCVRLMNEKEEESLALQLENASDPSDLLMQYRHSMAVKIYQYCENNPADAHVRDYRNHLRAIESGTPTNSQLLWPEIRAIMRQLVAQDTLVTAATTYTASLFEDFLADVVILDEAGMATEADVLMALHLRLGSTKLLLLAGDPKQLRPVVKSASAERNILGNLLETSPLERLLRCFKDIPFVTLVENFRGHESTWAMANRLFYFGDMKPGGDLHRFSTPTSVAVNAMLRKLIPAGAVSDAIINGSDRQIFFDVHTFSQPEDNGTSHFNTGGMVAIVDLVKLLLAAGIPGSEIGIITMYSEDKRRMIQRLRAARSDMVDVSTVDGFQGDSKTIVIVHFVATHPFASRGGRAHPFGHIGQAPRLCVSTTRAREYQFLVGNMHYWDQWLDTKPMLSPKSKYMVALMEYVKEKRQRVAWYSCDKRLTK